MAFTAGEKLGPYEIISLIGKGGMGEVYSAHDSRTGRDVASKFRPSASASASTVKFAPSPRGPSIFGSMSITTRPSVSFGTPVRAPRSGFNTAAPGTARPYDILPDGKHFIGVVPAAQTQPGGAAAQIQVVLNWFDDVKQRVPGR